MTRVVVGFLVSVLLAAGGGLLMAHGEVWSVLTAFGLWILPYCAAPLTLIDDQKDEWPPYAIFIFAGLMFAGGIFSGGLAYHEIAGERVDAVVTAVECMPGSDPCDERYRVAEWSTERDLGRLFEKTDRPYEPGDRLEVSMDPAGWAAPLVRDEVSWWRWAGLVLALIGFAGALITVAAAAVIEWWPR